MKKRIIYMSLALAASMHAAAQETYLNAALSTRDLNGTARYVGMGGAMDALGADLSTISTNPAGIGLFRSSQAKVSFGMVSQQGAEDFLGAQKNNMSFDQAGFVWAIRTSKRSFVNVAFNYTKSANFDFILSAAGKLDKASQNKLSYLKGAAGLFELDTDNSGNMWGWQGNDKSDLYNTADYLYYNAFLTSKAQDGSLSYGYNDASAYQFGRAHTGYVGQYDINLSGNANDRFYWGFTVGISDVHYNAESQYTENILNASNQDAGTLTMNDTRRITGTGYDIKAGVIFRPVETSPFRIGLSVATPTFYDLTSYSNTTLENGTKFGAYDHGNYETSYDFRLNTPWRFGLSAGTTVGDYLAVGAGYEYADYASLDTRIKDGGYYDDWGNYSETSSSDKAMNSATKKTLKGVSTLKIGAEFRPDPSIAVRLGYNYVSPMYRSDAEKGTLVSSISNAYTSTTDYTNWKATNRITAGLGWTLERFTVDVAYQYQQTNGTFYPFAGFEAKDPSTNEVLTNYADGVKVKNQRHQVMLTLGYRF